MDKPVYRVQILFKDSSTSHNYNYITSVHEEFSYTTLVDLQGVVIKFLTSNIFRIKILPGE